MCVCVCVCVCVMNMWAFLGGYRLKQDNFYPAFFGVHARNSGMGCSTSPKLSAPFSLSQMLMSQVPMASFHPANSPVAPWAQTQTQGCRFVAYTDTGTAFFFCTVS